MKSSPLTWLDLDQTWCGSLGMGVGGAGDFFSTSLVSLGSTFLYSAHGIVVQPWRVISPWMGLTGHWSNPREDSYFLFASRQLCILTLEMPPLPQALYYVAPANLESLVPVLWQGLVNR